MNQVNFNFDAAMSAKRAGQKRVEENNQRFMEVARRTAKRISMRSGSVTADDVRRECPFDPLHPNAWGAVFRTKEFVWTGDWQRSEQVQGRGNMQRVWQWRPVN